MIRCIYISEVSQWQDIIKGLTLTTDGSKCLQMERYYFQHFNNTVFFTRRELQYAVFLKYRKYKEIAAIFNVSIRTVEFYMATMKRKFQCQRKSDLIRILDGFGFYQDDPKLF